MKTVAIFDFDHTLITGDSFWPFLTAAAGKFATYAALAEGLARYAAQGGYHDSMRTFLKAYLLQRLIKGKKRDDLSHAAAATCAWQTINQPVMKALRDHYAQGHMIVIASGGLDLYLPELLRDVPHHAVICTDIGVEDGRVTGAMTKGNCVRLRKAERVAEWLQDNGPFDDTYGYGNAPHDLPMLELLNHKVIV
jgi:HAD superfamily hydrolase (TIGR01490 family)